jgi:hypothetical protein
MPENHPDLRATPSIVRSGNSVTHDHTECGEPSAEVCAPRPHLRIAGNRHEDSADDLKMMKILGQRAALHVHPLHKGAYTVWCPVLIKCNL